MAYHGPPANMRPGVLPPPPGMFPPPHPSYGPPPMMMVPQMGQQAAPGIMQPGVLPMPPPGMPPPMLVFPRAPDVKVPVPNSTTTMKIATTVFVGNISEKASDTLIRQILLRCGAIEGWKRVQDATGKLQGFGFCEYADPESTLRALRLLHDLKLGEKALVAKVDAKTRKELLKYLITKKHSKKGAVSESEVDAEVAKLEEDKDVATAALTSEVSEEAKAQDGQIQDAIKTLLKDYLAVLSSSKSNEDLQRERDVKESILFMAKQSGSIDPDSTLEDMDMEDEVKTLVSDEIKRFRESYKRSDEARKEKKAKDKDRESKRAREEEERARSHRKANGGGGGESPRTKEKLKRDRSRSPARRPSPPRRARSPQSRMVERQEKEKRKEAMRAKEKEEMMKEEEEHEERQRQRRTREREKAFKQRLANWESREYRKEKEHDKDAKREKERREEMEREKKHLGDFLAEYDDSRDDSKYYKGNAYGRRRHEREVEMENDDRDRLREKDELEELRLQVIERQAREILSGDAGRGSSGEESPMREEGEEGEGEEEEDMDVPVKEEEEEDIPLTKSGYTVSPAFPPIQVQSAPSVSKPVTEVASAGSSAGGGGGGGGSYRPIASTDHPSPSLRAKSGEFKQQQQGAGPSEDNSPASYNSPTTQSKLAFGLSKKQQLSGSAPSQSSGPGPSKLDKVFSMEDEEVENKPRKKLVPIDYSDEEGEEPVSGRERDSGDGRRHSRSSSGSRRRRSSQQHSDVGLVMRGSSLELLEEMKDRKLSSEERKKLVQTLVNSIPTAKEEVFEYKLKWEQIDEALIEKRIGPWINKKITEYIGEAEPILKDFICNKLSCHIAPEDILNDISMVLDDEAEVFIVKLWRLLIYETEAKHLGIAKNY